MKLTHIFSLVIFFQIIITDASENNLSNNEPDKEQINNDDSQNNNTKENDNFKNQSGDSSVKGVTSHLKNSLQLVPLNKIINNDSIIEEIIKKINIIKSGNSILFGNINKEVNKNKSNDILMSDFENLKKINFLKNKEVNYNIFRYLAFIKPSILFPINLYSQYQESYPKCTVDFNNLQVPCYWQFSNVFIEPNIKELIKNSKFNEAINIINQKIYSTKNEIQKLQEDVNSSDSQIVNLQEKALELEWILQDVSKLNNF